MPDTNNSTSTSMTLSEFESLLLDRDITVPTLIEAPNRTDFKRTDLDACVVHTAVGLDPVGDVVLVFSDSEWFSDNVDYAPGAYNLSPSEARQVAKALIEAATEADRRRRNDDVESV